MDDLVEWAFHALRALARLVLQLFVEVLLEYLISPLAKLVAAIYRCTRDLLRFLFRYEVVAGPLAAMATIVVLAGPLFIIGRALESLLMS